MKLGDIRNKIINAGVKKLQEFGYPQCNERNILTDRIYSAFFLSMLHNNIGHDYDITINALISEIERNQKGEK